MRTATNKHKVIKVNRLSTKDLKERIKSSHPNSAYHKHLTNQLISRSHG